MLVSMATDMDKIRGAIHEAVTEAFADIGGVEVDDIHVEHKLDHDGDPILSILLIFSVPTKAGQDDPVAARFSRLVRLTREKLDDLEEEAYPIYSFVDAEEYKSGAPA